MFVRPLLLPVPRRRPGPISEPSYMRHGQRARPRDAQARTNCRNIRILVWEMDPGLRRGTIWEDHMNIYDVNWIAVVAAALAGFLVGGIWYGPVMGKTWMGAVGLTEEELKEGNMGKIYGGAFAFSLVASWTLAHTFATYAVDLDFATKVLTAFGIALGFIVPAIGTNYLFSQKSKTLFLIDAGYWLLFYTAMGVVHAWLG
jgi:hypothetical protein